MALHHHAFVRKFAKNFIRALNKKFVSELFAGSCLLFASAALANPEAKVSLALSPVGHFTAETKAIIGTAHKMANGGVSAEKIEIPLDSLKTGIDVRDSHMKNKYLETQKFPRAILTDATGKDGNGVAMLTLHGVKKPVKGTYKIEGNELVVHFPVIISEYGVAKIKYMGVGVKDQAEVDARIPLK
jgi:hypothetical protein